MNLEKFITETKDYIHRTQGIFPRGDLHTLPRVHKEDLMHYFQSMHRFPRNRFLRFIKKMKSRRMIIDSNEHSLTFDPTFIY